MRSILSNIIIKQSLEEKLSHSSSYSRQDMTYRSSNSTFSFLISTSFSRAGISASSLMKDLHFFFNIPTWLKATCSTWNKMGFSVTPKEQVCSLQRLQCDSGPIVKRAVSPHGLIFIRNKNLFQKPLPLQLLHWPRWQYVSMVKLKPSVARGLELPGWPDMHICHLGLWRDCFPGHQNTITDHPARRKRLSSLSGQPTNPVCMVWSLRLVGGVEVSHYMDKRVEKRNEGLCPDFPVSESQACKNSFMLISVPSFPSLTNAQINGCRCYQWTSQVQAYRTREKQRGEGAFLWGQGNGTDLGYRE